MRFTKIEPPKNARYSGLTENGEISPLKLGIFHTIFIFTVTAS